MSPDIATRNATSLRMRRRLVLWLSGALIGVLLFFQMSALERESVRMEAVAIRVILNEIQAQLVIKAAEMRLSGATTRLLALRGGNPVEWMRTSPANYIGACPDEPVAGSWCFQRAGAGDSGWLRYYPINAAALGIAPAGLVWRLDVDFVDRNDNGKPDYQDRIKGLQLLVDPDRDASNFKASSGATRIVEEKAR